MPNIKFPIAIVFLLSCNTIKKEASPSASLKEPYRPQIHFSPQQGWMNDPNGMVFYKGAYHLFYQHYPDSTVWGPMHWGHATSTDLVHWQDQPIALYPDSLGYIFSGSAVVDSNNTSGFAKDGKIPLVAIFTHHNPEGEKKGIKTYQNQSLAYSLDDGNTWTKYSGNPVLKNPGIKDFRDPKVSWHDETKNWIMTLATPDRITFYSSPDLKNWKKESEFGSDVGAHGGVWECPDLLPMQADGEAVWLLIVNINPGGPNGGSATQYFTGRFDGHVFTPFATDTRWLDYGPDEYAGITWSNTGGRKIFLGWMSNWQYADRVPTKNWRSAMTVPRDLSIEKVGEKYLVRSKPVPELNSLVEKPVVWNNIEAGTLDLTAKIGTPMAPARLQLTSDTIDDFFFTLSNASGEKVVVGYRKAANVFFIDRTASGKTAFEKGFAAIHTAPRFSTKPSIDLTVVIDEASIELFADNGLTTMTTIFFPDSPFSNLTIQSKNHPMKSLQYNRIRSAYNRNDPSSSQKLNKAD